MVFKKFNFYKRNVYDQQSYTFINFDDVWNARNKLITTDAIVVIDVCKWCYQLINLTFPREAVGEKSNEHYWLDITNDRVFNIIKSNIDSTIQWMVRRNSHWVPKIILNDLESHLANTGFEIDAVDVIRYANELIEWFHDKWKGEVLIKGYPPILNDIMYDGILLEEGYSYNDISEVQREVPVFVIEYYKNYLHALLGKWSCNRYKKDKPHVFFTGLNKKTGLIYFNI